MKLNKVLALALSGVMAVSMLAGCSGNGASDKDDGGVVVNNGTAANVIAALDEDTTNVVSFSEDASLQAALEKAVKNAGNNANAVTAKVLNQIDPDISKSSKLTALATSSAAGIGDSHDKEVSKMTVVTNNSQTPGMSEEYLVDVMANMIDKKVANLKLSEADKGVTFTDKDGNEYWYTFDYTGNVAVAEMTDAVTGVTTYVAVYTITRTPTKVEK